MAKREPAGTISSAPLFARLGKRSGAAARFARDLDITDQRLTNWKRRGIPAAALPKVATAIGLTVEDYLVEAGRPVTVARQPSAAYLTDDERELLELYRRASGRWKVAIKHMAKLRGDAAQDEASESLMVVLAKIAAEPVTDDRVETAYGLPPGHKQRR